MNKQKASTILLIGLNAVYLNLETIFIVSNGSSFEAQ